MPLYAEILNGRVRAATERAKAPTLPAPWIVREVTDGSRPERGWHYDSADGTYRSPEDIDLQQRIELVAVNPETGEPQTEIFELIDDDIDPVTQMPKIDRSNKWCILTGTAKQPNGALDPQAQNDSWLISTPHPRGGLSYARYRIEGGKVELETPGGWVNQIPFWRRESGIFEMHKIVENVMAVNRLTLIVKHVG